MSLREKWPNLLLMVAGYCCSTIFPLLSKEKMREKNSGLSGENVLVQ